MLPERPLSVGPAGSHIDRSINGGYLTPEVFQQYLAQFPPAFGPYAYTGYGLAPAPPDPYAIQATGYNGFLVPSTSTSISASGTISNTAGNILTTLTNLITNLMDSTVLRAIITAIGAILMNLFGGAIITTLVTAFCNITNLCDFSFKAITYFRGNGAGDVGRMLAEEMTPERLRLASQFVRSAIRKYHDMQKVRAEEKYF